MGKADVCVTIVTYNRAEYLQKLLEALWVQTYDIKTVIIVDNASSDGTDCLLKNNGYIDEAIKGKTTKFKKSGIEVLYYLSEWNTGGSGGFYKALDIAQSGKYDYVWIMDDDVLPEANCLEILINSLSDTSRVAIPNRGDERYDDYAIQSYDLINPFLFHVNECKRNVVNSKEMTEKIIYVEDMAFEGPLMSFNILQKVGLPNKDLFILFDDTEYAHRILQFTKISFVKDAILHKQIIQDSRKSFWSWKSYYSIRNAAYFDRYYGKNIAVKYLRPFLRKVDLIIRALLKGNWKRIKWITRAHKEGVNCILGKTLDPSDLDC